MSVSALAKASQLPVSSIYWHFGSKDGVLAAVVERRLEEFFAAAPESREFAGDASTRLISMLQSSGERLEREPDYLRLLLLLTLEHHDGEPRSVDAVRQMRRVAAERWTRAIDDAVEESGREPRRELSVDELAILSRAVADGALVAGLADGGNATSEIFEILGRVLLAVIGE